MKEENTIGLVLDINLLEETPLTLAAKFQNLETCGLIIDTLTEPKLTDILGYGSLQKDCVDASVMKISKQIIDRFQDKYPKIAGGFTLLHAAATCGNWELYQLIIKRWSEAESFLFLKSLLPS